MSNSNLTFETKFINVDIVVDRTDIEPTWREPAGPWYGSHWPYHRIIFLTDPDDIYRVLEAKLWRAYTSMETYLRQVGMIE